MEYGFTEQEEALRRTVQEFARKELAPNYIKRARSGEFPWDVWKQMSERGLTGIRIPEKWGGAGANAVSVGIVAEEMARGDVNCAFLVFLDEEMGDFIMEGGTPEQKDEWLPNICQAKKIIGFGLTEPGCGSDASALKTRAIRDGDDYIISGEKTSISAVMAAESAVVIARTDPDAGNRGITAFIIPLNAPGVSRYAFDDIGFLPIGRGNFIMDDVRVPKSSILGEEGKGFYLAAGKLDYARVIVALMALGAAQSALETATEYAKQRFAFGQPISKFEGVSFPIAEHLTRIEACRLLCYKALWMKDNDMVHTKESAMCKWWGPELAVDAIHSALLIHGHYGYTHDLPFGQLINDITGYQIGDGMAQIQKVRIMREIMGAEFSP